MELMESISDKLHGPNVCDVPKDFIIDKSKWKYIVRTVLRGKNMLIYGPRGCGKTRAAFEVAKFLDRPLFNIPLGATQDPRSTLIGNTHFNKDTGTFFTESEFVRAIQTENAIIILDELSRANPEAWNILMSVLDYTQRFLRIDESNDVRTIKVARGVSFVATANIGSGYTATRVLDLALIDRFSLIEMSRMDKTQMILHLNALFPNQSVDNTLLASFYHDLVTESQTDDGKIREPISTRLVEEVASLIHDGFDFEDAVTLSVLPHYMDAGIDDERTFVTQLLVKYKQSANRAALLNQSSNVSSMTFD